MSNIKTSKTIMIYMSTFLFFVSSYSIMCIPYASNLTQKEDLILRVGAVVCWLTLIIGYILIFIIDFSRRKNRRKIKNKITRHAPGIVRFYGNKPAKIVDTLFIVSITLFIILQFFEGINEYISYGLLSTSLFLFHMHCFVNGENFRCIISKKIRSEQ